MSERRIPRPLIRVADIFMIAMWSRPQTGSLAVTRVTIVSLWLGAVSAVGVALLVPIVTLSGIAALIKLLLLIAMVAYVAGAASVALVGLLQRL